MAPLNIAWLLQAWTVLGATSYAVGARPGLRPALVPVLLALGRHRARPGRRPGRRVGAPRPARHRTRAAGAARAARRHGRRSRSPAAHRPCSTESRPCASPPAVASTAQSGRWCGPCSSSLLVARARRGRARRRARAPGRPPARPRRAAGGDRPLRRRGPTRLGDLAGAGPHRPGRHLALGADAPRPGRAGAAARRSSRSAAPSTGTCCDLARPGRLRRRAAVRGERLVPGRPRRAVARQPAGRPRGWCSPPGPGADRDPARRGRWPRCCWPPCAPGCRPPPSWPRCCAPAVVVAARWSPPSLRWSVRRPFAVDLRSCPRHPRTAAGDGRLLHPARADHHVHRAGLLRAGPGAAPEVSVLVASPFLVWSMIRLLHARDAWTDPVQRATVVATVAG